MKLTDRTNRYLRNSLIGLLVLGVIYVAVEEVYPRVVPKRFATLVDDGLYRSGRIHPDLLPKVLEEHGIDTIVALTYPVKDHEWQREEARIAEEMGINIVRYPLLGNGTGDTASYLGALSKVNEELGDGRQVLVHCAAGTQRTGGFSFLYRTLVLGDTPETAYEEMTRMDFDPVDNPDLLPYLWEITPEVANHLSMDSLPDDYSRFFEDQLQLDGSDAAVSAQ